ncbi:MAG: hypothetical protein GX421_12460 [Caldisericales bacterium]|nr:hypothetical protein [Caldisericales bacterium]
MFEAIARMLPRKLVLAAFQRMVNHCKLNSDPEIQNDARYTDNTRAQWQRVIDGEVAE